MPLPSMNISHRLKAMTSFIFIDAIYEIHRSFVVKWVNMHIGFLFIILGKGAIRA